MSGAGGAVLGESANALELSEGSHPPVIYFPREDIGMAFLEPSETTSVSQDIGTATYFSVSGPDGDIQDAAWSYEAPNDGVAAIKNHIAFHSDRVAVEKL